jgi:AICAR transformylase/IMP cyclohydrolase PurH
MRARASYDAAISSWFAAPDRASPSRRASRSPASLRADAALRREPAPVRRPSTCNGPTGPASPTARQVQGKELSYNNLNDTDAAFEAVAEFDAARPSSSSSTPTPAAWPMDATPRRRLGPRAACDPGQRLRRHRRR